MNPNDRYDYFIRKITDFEKVWGLYNDGWAMSSGPNKNEMMVFWPEKEFAKLCANGTWENYKPKNIKLNTFLDKWLPGMEKDGLSIGIFQTPDDKGVIMTPSQLLENIRSELGLYD